MAAADSPTDSTLSQKTRTHICVVDIRFCHTCGFRYKAAWLAGILSKQLPTTKVTLSPVTTPLGSFVVSVNGKSIYEKSRSFHADEPQPTPKEINSLVQNLTSQALTPKQLLEYQALHKGQIKAGMSPPWAVKLFDPHTGAVINNARFEDWQLQKVSFLEAEKKTSVVEAKVAAPRLLHLSGLRAAIKGLMRCAYHDDGSYAPLLIRLAWHCCGTFDKTTQTGGSNGGTMRFPVEQKDPENAGLAKARALLDPLLKKFPGISTADLYVLAGYVAFEYVGGPKMQFAVGRKDFTFEEAVKVYGRGGCPFGDGKLNKCGSRLPAGDLGSKAANIAAFRGIFRRLGMTDREGVALIVMGHGLGRMHEKISGFSDATWSHAPIRWSLDRDPGFMFGLCGPSYAPRRAPNGGQQFVNSFGFQLLPGADMPLLWDPALNKILHEFNSNRRLLRVECSKAWKKLTTLGCTDLTPEIAFKEDIMANYRGH